MLGTAKRPNSKGLGELMSILQVVQNSDEYAKKVDELTALIARNEELCGAFDSLQAAENYRKESKADREAAAAELLAAKVEAKAMRDDAASKAQASRTLREDKEAKASAALQAAEDAKMLAETSLAKREADAEKREAAIEKRQSDLDRREAKIKAEAEKWSTIRAQLTQAIGV